MIPLGHLTICITISKARIRGPAEDQPVGTHLLEKTRVAWYPDGLQTRSPQEQIEQPPSEIIIGDIRIR